MSYPEPKFYGQDLKKTKKFLMKTIYFLVFIGLIALFLSIMTNVARTQETGQTSLQAYVIVENIEKESASFHLIYNVPEVYLKDITELKIGYTPEEYEGEADIRYVILTPDGKTYPDGQLRTKKSFVEGLTSKTTYRYVFLVTYKGKVYAAKSSKEDIFTTK